MFRRFFHFGRRHPLRTSGIGVSPSDRPGFLLLGNAREIEAILQPVRTVEEYREARERRHNEENALMVERGLFDLVKGLFTLTANESFTNAPAVPLTKTPPLKTRTLPFLFLVLRQEELRVSPMARLKAKIGRYMPQSVPFFDSFADASAGDAASLVDPSRMAIIPISLGPDGDAVDDLESGNHLGGPQQLPAPTLKYLASSLRKALDQLIGGDSKATTSSKSTDLAPSIESTKFECGNVLKKRRRMMRGHKHKKRIRRDRYKAKK